MIATGDLWAVLSVSGPFAGSLADSSSSRFAARATLGLCSLYLEYLLDSMIPR